MCGHCAARFPIWSCSRWGLPCRWCCHPRGALLPHHFTLTGAACAALRRYLSVALSVGSRPPGVTWHLALWSPDFPPCACRARQRLPGRLLARTIRSRGVIEHLFEAARAYRPRCRARPVICAARCAACFKGSSANSASARGRARRRDRPRRRRRPRRGAPAITQHDFAAREIGIRRGARRASSRREPR